MQDKLRVFNVYKVSKCLSEGENQHKVHSPTCAAEVRLEGGPAEATKWRGHG